MTKAFFYETVDGTLHRCIFAGLDSEGEPQSLMMEKVDLSELDVEDKLMFDKIISSEL